MTLIDYVLRKKWVKGLVSIEHSVYASIQRLEDYIEKREEGLITVIRNDTNNTKPTERQKLENKNGKKNNTMDILHD